MSRLSEGLFRLSAGIKYAIINGLVCAVVAGVIADQLTFRSNIRICVVVICFVVGSLFGLRFGIHLSPSPSENPPGQCLFYTLVLIIGIFDLLIFAATVMTGKLGGSLVTGGYSSIQASRSHDTISYLFYSTLWFTSGILGVGVGLAGLRLPINLPRFLWREGIITRTQTNWRNLPEGIKILILFGFVSSPLLILVLAAMMN